MIIFFHFKKFFSSSKPIGVLLLVCTAFSLIMSNCAFGNAYLSFWNQKLAFNTGTVFLPETPLQMVNDLLMSLFFFLTTLEIKRETKKGALSTPKKSLMPVISACGGMLLPILIYFIFCHGKENYKGWAIPMATDIAFSLGVLSLLGNKIPPSLRIFLMALAVIDDIGGIAAIALFYGSNVHWLFLLFATMIYLYFIILNHYKITHLFLFILPGIILWYCILQSGLHPTLAGVLIGLAIPSTHIRKLEYLLHRPVNYFILPLFALANTAFALDGNVFVYLWNPVHSGVFYALILGKPIGIILSTLIAAKTGIAALPDDIKMKPLIGLGLLAGIGFTVSLFITSLAFADAASTVAAKLAIINASIISGVVGYCFLRFNKRKI